MRMRCSANQQYLEHRDDDPVNIFSKRIDIGVMHKNLKAYTRALEYFRQLSRSLQAKMKRRSNSILPKPTGL